MMIANQVLSAELAKKTNWVSLYWWNQNSKTKWYLDNKRLDEKSIPAYNFDFLFEKLRPVFLLQEDEELLASFKLILQVSNPADALCKLAISLANEELIK